MPSAPNPPQIDAYTRSNVAERIWRPWSFRQGLEATALRLTTSPTSGYVIVGDESGNFSWASISALTFLDSTFRITDDGDPTLKLGWQLSNLTAERIWTAQDLDGTVPLLEASQTWQGANYYVTTIQFEYDPGNGTPQLLWHDNAGLKLGGLVPVGITTSPVWTLPDLTGTLATLENVQIWTAHQRLLAGTTFEDPDDRTKFLTMSLEDATSGVQVIFLFDQTASRIFSFPDATTTLVGYNTTQTLSNKTLDTTTIADAANLVLNTTTGTKIGTGTTQKLAFHNSTPVAQRAGAAQAAAATTAATNIAPYGYTTAGQADAIVALLNEIRAALVEKGLIKGSA